MARVTVTTTAAAVCQNAATAGERPTDLAQSDYRAVSFLLLPQVSSGTVLLKHLTAASSSLGAGINASVTSLAVASGAGAFFPASGTLTVESEQMTFTRSGDTFTVARGSNSTTAATHAAGVAVTASAPDMSDAARVDLSKISTVSFVCEPGVALWAQAASGTLAVDVLRGGER